MAKTITRLVLLATLFTLAAGCSGAQGKTGSPGADPCGGLAGQERINCEERQRGENRLM